MCMRTTGVPTKHYLSLMIDDFLYALGTKHFYATVCANKLKVLYLWMAPQGLQNGF